MKKVFDVKKLYGFVSILIVFSAYGGERPIEMAKPSVEHVSKWPEIDHQQQQEIQAAERKRQEEEAAAEKKRLDEQKALQVSNTQKSQPTSTTTSDPNASLSITASGKIQYIPESTPVVPSDGKEPVTTDDQDKKVEAAKNAFTQNESSVLIPPVVSSQVSDTFNKVNQVVQGIVTISTAKYSPEGLKKATEFLSVVHERMEKDPNVPKELSDKVLILAQNGVNSQLLNRFMAVADPVLHLYGKFESVKDQEGNEPLDVQFLAQVKVVLPAEVANDPFQKIRNFLKIEKPTLQDRKDFLSSINSQIGEFLENETAFHGEMSSWQNPALSTMSQVADQSLKTVQQAVYDSVQKILNSEVQIDQQAAQAQGEAQVYQQAAQAQVVLQSSLKTSDAQNTKGVQFDPEVADSQGGKSPLDGNKPRPKQTGSKSTDAIPSSIASLSAYSVDGFDDFINKYKPLLSLDQVPQEAVLLDEQISEKLKALSKIKLEIGKNRSNFSSEFISGVDKQYQQLLDQRDQLKPFVDSVKKRVAEQKIKNYTDQMTQLNASITFSDDDFIKIRQLASDLAKVYTRADGISDNALLDQALQIAQFDKNFQVSEGDFQKLSDLMMQSDPNKIREKYFSKAIEYELQKIEKENKNIADKKELFDTGKMSAEDYKKFLDDNQSMVTAQEALKEFNDALQQGFSNATKTPEMQQFIKQPVNYIQRQYDAVAQSFATDNKTLFSLAPDSFEKFGDRVSKLTDYYEKLQKISKDILTLLTNKPLAFEKSSDGKNLSPDEVKLLLLDELESVVSEFPDIQAFMKDKPATALLSLPREDLLKLQGRRKVILEEQMNGNPALAHEWNQVRDFSLVLETPETFALFEQKLAGQSITVDVGQGTVLRDKIFSLYTEVRTELEPVDKLKADLSSAQEIQKRLQGSPSDVSLKDQKAEILNRMQKRLVERYSDLEDIIAKVRVRKPLTSSDIQLVRDCVNTESLEKQLYETLDSEHQQKELSDLLSKVFSDNNDGLKLVMASEWLLNKSQIQAPFIQDVQTRASAFTIPKSEVARWQNVQKGSLTIAADTFNTELATISEQYQTAKDLLVDLQRALDALKKSSQDKTTTDTIKNLQASQARLIQTSGALDSYKTFLERTDKVTTTKELFDQGKMAAEAYRDFLNSNKDVPAGKSALQEFNTILQNAFSSATQTPEMQKFVKNPMNYLTAQFDSLTALFDKENTKLIHTDDKLQQIETDRKQLEALSDVVSAVATSSELLAFEKDAIGKILSSDDVKLLMVSELGSVVSQFPVIAAKLNNKPVTALLSLPREDLLQLQQAKVKQFSQGEISFESQRVRDFGHILKTPEIFTLFARKMAGNPLVIDQSKLFGLLEKMNTTIQGMNTFINGFKF